MLGRTHAGFAAAGYMPYAYFALDNPSPMTQVVGALLCAGCGVLPDIDERNSTISRLIINPISRTLRRASSSSDASWITHILGRLSYRAFKKLSGGHRIGTHSWVAVALGAALSVACSYIPILSVITMSIAFMLAFRLMIRDGAQSRYVLMSIFFAIVLAWFSSTGLIDLFDALLAIPLGIMYHIIGDWMTPDGVAFLWPFSEKKYAIGLFKTNSPQEHWIAQPLITLALGIMVLIWIIAPSLEWFASDGFELFLRWMDSVPVLSDLGNA